VLIVGKNKDLSKYSNIYFIFAVQKLAMASFLTLYHQIETKLFKIKQVVEEKTEENKVLKTNLAMALDKIDKLENENLLLNERTKILTITKTVLYKEDKKQTEKKIEKLVRDIDHCMELLNRMQWKTD
jgi:hypothetical protein